MLRTAKGRNILTFFACLAVSAGFWMLMALNDDVQHDYAMPIELTDFPDNATILSGYNSTLNLTIKDKGSSQLKFGLGRRPTMKLRFGDFVKQKDSILLLSPVQLNSAVRSIFGTGATIVGMRPDSLRIVYTTNRGIKVPVAINAEVHTQPQYTYSGTPTLSPDTVILYANSHKRFKVHSLTTQQISLDNLTDSTTVEAVLNVPAGMRAIPSTVKATFPVEPLVSKQQQVQVELANVPPGMKIVTFPSMVEVSYLLPKSMYNGEPAKVKATVDCRGISSSRKTLEVSLSKLPSRYRNVTVKPTHVEYVIEKD